MCVCVCVRARECVCHEDITLHCTTVAYVSSPEILSHLTPDKSKVAAFRAILACRRTKVQLSSFLSSALDRVQWAHMTSPQLYPPKYPRYPLNMRLGGLKSGSGLFEEETDLCSFWDSKSASPSPWSSHCTDCAILILYASNMWHRSLFKGQTQDLFLTLKSPN